ncbi:cell wall hydrolase [Sphingorhabdus sp.]|uniref:cell wall hydrolase n=1 Tax=Sphingorhabdus sp. TaxID=1902408 RepID=UPI0039192791
MAIKNLERSKKLRQLSLLTAIVLVSGSATSLWLAERTTKEPRPDLDINAPNGLSVPPSPELQIYKPLPPEKAIEENEKLPFSTAPLERALPLVLPAYDVFLVGRKNATDCLTSAIYYEAGNELSQGKRAVAQVVLNRVRHPAYPKSICGVVYQGAERKTGCQFTFTCDGSLARRPTRGGWEQARMIAIGAISGVVEPSVGMATHYHANYVVPYWASSLDKVSQIGTHIFYRWKGTWGRRRAFSQTVELDSEATNLVTSVDFLPVPEETLSIERQAEKVASRLIADDVLPTGALVLPTPELKAPVTSRIQADQTGSKLLIDEKPILKN